MGLSIGFNPAEEVSMTRRETIRLVLLLVLIITVLGMAAVSFWSSTNVRNSSQEILDSHRTILANQQQIVTSISSVATSNAQRQATRQASQPTSVFDNPLRSFWFIVVHQLNWTYRLEAVALWFRE